MKTSEEVQAILRKVRRIELKTKGLSAQIFSGGYRTKFKGRGMLFSEVRPYQYGDDVRNIDWNVTARTNEPHVKLFEEERELTFMLLVDVSGSSFFGTQSQTKQEFAAELAASLAFSVVENSDKIGAILYSDRVEHYIPPKKGKAQALQIIRHLMQPRPQSKGSSLAAACRYLTNIQQRRCTAFVLSDFWQEGHDEGLKIAAQRHDLIGMHLHDEKEEHLPAVGLLPLRDAETGELLWVDTDSADVRAAHSRLYQTNLESFRQAFWRHGADTLSLNIEKPYAKTLMEFFKNRAG